MPWGNVAHAQTPSHEGNNMNNIGFFSRIGTAIARFRSTLDAGPGNTSGEPMSVAGHLVFAPVTHSTRDASA
jgi:hypothetical protein